MTDRPNPQCATCEDEGWVCENHNDKPWRRGEGGCDCGAGQPCDDCNPSDRNNPPRMPPGFVDWKECN